MTDNLAIIVASISAAISGVGLVVQALGVRSMHRTSDNTIKSNEHNEVEAAKRDATAKIAESYVRFNEAMLTNERAFKAARDYLWHHVSDDEFIYKRTFWSLLLNTIYLEYKFACQGLSSLDSFRETATLWGRAIGKSDCESFVVYLNDAIDFSAEFRDVFRQAALDASHQATAEKLGLAPSDKDRRLPVHQSAVVLDAVRHQASQGSQPKSHR